tara:strand:+ start:154 stop:396 length:243 start_codon:yes stop_codon:yes gene_type:complete
MDSINTDDRVDSHLAILLESYETNLTNVVQFIEQHEDQLSGAKTHKEELVSKIEEIRDILGLEEESEEPKLKIVEGQDIS